MGAIHKVRSRGREHLRLSTGIRGNGWCVTHALLREVPYRYYSLTEDVEYGIALGLAGHRVQFAGEANADELKEYLKAKLPEYMVPGVYVKLAELPLNTNGKVDRKALANLQGKNLEAKEADPPAITPVEELLIDICADVLGVSGISMRDSFYDLGGDSLLALRLVSRVNDYFRMEISVRVLLEYPVLTAFAQRLRSISERPAQELEKIYPQLVKSSQLISKTIDKTSQPNVKKTLDAKSVNYTALVPILLEAIKEQQTEIEQQQIEINNLKNIVNNKDPKK